MSKRTRRKAEHTKVFLVKEVFNSRFIVRNIMALTAIVTVIALGCGATVMLRDGRKVAATEQAVSGAIEEVVTLDGSYVVMDTGSIQVLKSDFDASIQTGKEAKDKQMVAAAASDFANMFVATEDNVNIRQEASTDSSVVGRMNTGVCGDVLGTDGEWTKISSGEVTGYVLSTYIKSGAEGYEIAKNYYATTATVAEDGVCLRAGASKDAEVLGAVYENVTYKVVADKTTDSWVCVQVSDGGEGYVSADYMQVSEGYPVAEKVAVDEQETTEATTEETTEATTEATTETSKGKVEEDKTSQKTPEKTTTQAPTTQAPSNEVSIEVTSRTPIALSDADINLMAAVMTLECGGEPYEGQLAVANVILNRLQMGNWGGTISDVVYAPYQFSVVSDPRLQNLIDNGAQASCIQAAREACSGVNNIGDLIGFRPTWNIDKSSVAAYKQIGNHVFFKY